MTDSSNHHLPDIPAVEVQIETLRSYNTEEEFTSLAVDLLREVTSHVCVAASLLPGDTRAWTRNQAVLGGLLVRLFKMLSAVLDQTCQHRRETTFVFVRLAFECCVNVRYLIAEDSNSLYDSFVAYSLRHERKLFDRIHANIKTRGREPWPIEQRMLASIDRSADTSGISLENVTKESFAQWKNSTLFDRAQAIGWQEAYLFFVGGPSHAVHGNWQDLLEYHLEESENGFAPDLDWHQPRPQPLFAIGLLSLTVVADYLTHLVGEDASPVIDDLNDLQGRLSLANHEHEAFLSSRQTD